jgi:hypothetical protein
LYSLWIEKEVLKAEGKILTEMMKEEAMETGMEKEDLEIGMAAEVLVTETIMAVLKGKCIRLHALNAAMNALFLLSLFKTSLFIAGIVL